MIKKEITWGGRKLTLETGRLANQATGSVLVTYGETMVLCTVVADKKASEEVNFFPLTVNYIEKFYAAGKIPGGFSKREGRPSEKETLVSRLIDRPIRPLFHEKYRNETQIICTVLSIDGKNDPDIPSLIGASAALAVSGIPFLGPIAAAKVGYKNNEYILNPYVGEESELDLVVAGTKSGVLMVESGAKELCEKEMLDAIKFGHKAFQEIIDLITELKKEGGKPDWKISDEKVENPFTSKIAQSYHQAIEDAYNHKLKQDRISALDRVYEEILANMEHEEDDVSQIKLAFAEVCSLYMRSKLLNEGKRIDGRKNIDIRPISVATSLLPNAHGSAIFNRGETQVLSITTLGSSQDEQLVDALFGEYKERFMLHYNFPPFSVGEISRLGTPGRREIGHGKLALKALSGVFPTKDEFPYSVRVVAEVLTCNGSSSMATVCSGSLSLMDAGVPLKRPVAGIAMGLVTDGATNVILSDIMSEEDHLGDMDFKVAGTNQGITALQMDIKVTSVTFEIMEQALNQAKVGRVFILDEMSKVLNEARPELNKNAPKMESLIVPKAKIREVIGSGGKVIREIIEESGAKVDIDDDGNVTITAANQESVEKAITRIKAIAFDPEVDQIYDAKVIKIMEFGAFVRFYGAKEGLVHISEMSDKRVKAVTDILNEGDEIKVKFLGFDNKGRPKLTLKI